MRPPPPTTTLTDEFDPEDFDSGFLTYLDVRELPGGHEWMLIGDLVYRGNTDTFTVPAGFTTDFTSSPWITRSLVAKVGPHTKAAVLHDYLYVMAPWVKETDAVKLASPDCPRRRRITRREADGLFLKTMLELGYNPIRAHLAYQGVCLGGAPVWARARARELRELESLANLPGDES